MSRGDRAALFVRDGEWFVPTPLSTGPWRADAMHGGPPSALVGSLVAAERSEDETVARVQIDLERPVPMAPLLAQSERRRISRRLTRIDVELSSESGLAVCARALLVHRDPFAVPALTSAAPGPEGFEPVDWSDLYPDDSFVRQAVEHRMVQGHYRQPGPAAAWLRLCVPVVGGHEPDPLAQLLAVADFGSPLSMSSTVPGRALINVDVNVTLFRDPHGPWFLLEARGQVGEGGIGLAATRLADAKGALGVITQSQVAIAYGAPPPSAQA